MARALIERRLKDVSHRLKTLTGDLGLAAEQLAHLSDEAEEARMRALVSETPLAEHDYHEAERHAEAMRRHHGDLVAQVRQLEQDQDELLDRLVAQT